MGSLTRVTKAALPAIFVVFAGSQDAAQAAMAGDVTHATHREMELASIIQVDALGFRCIQESDIDRAFHMSGKGLRLPRTCLPAPCNAALSQEGLADLIGRMPTTGEWDDYYARYADTCRAEVLPDIPEAEVEPVFTAGDMAPFDVLATALGVDDAPYPSPLPTVEVSDPGSILAQPSGVSSNTQTASANPIPPPLPSGSSATGTGSALADLAAPDQTGFTQTRSEGTTSLAQTPAAVPLPPALLLFATAFAALLKLRTSKQRTA